MWRFVSVAAPAEPVTLEQARRQCNLLSAETEFDDKLALLIAAARRHIHRPDQHRQRHPRRRDNRQPHHPRHNVDHG
mgnify:CR=1 FL=1